ncbi:MAG: hypothetical protein WHX52_06020 [Anaerolineae bacterium]
MPVYLLVAYIIFCVTPLGLAFSIAARRRKVEREIAALTKK